MLTESPEGISSLSTTLNDEDAISFMVKDEIYALDWNGNFRTESKTYNIHELLDLQREASKYAKKIGIDSIFNIIEHNRIKNTHMTLNLLVLYHKCLENDKFNHKKFFDHYEDEIYLYQYDHYEGRCWKKANAISMYMIPTPNILERLVKFFRLTVDTVKVEIYEGSKWRFMTNEEMTGNKELDVVSKIDRIDHVLSPMLRKREGGTEGFGSRSSKLPKNMLTSKYRSLIGLDEETQSKIT